MPDPKAKTCSLEASEFALIIGEEDGSMTIRIDGAGEPADGEPLSDAAEIVMALAQRLINDPEFHDEVIDWWDSHADDDDAAEDAEDAEKK